jgi:hypothetical protein
MGREGLIDRRGSAGDRRVIFATLTDAGLELAERTRTVYLAAVREVVVTALPDGSLDGLAAQVRPLRAAARPVRERVPSVDEVATARDWDPTQPERRRRARTGPTGPVPLPAVHSSPT